MVSRDGVIGRGDVVKGHFARAAKVEHGDGAWISLDIAQIVVMELERSAAGRIHAAQVNILHFHVIDFEIVPNSSRMVCDDAVAGVDVCPANNYSTG